MKLYQLFLTERINKIESLIDRDDLIMIMDVFKIKVKDYRLSGNCFVNAVASSLSLQLKTVISSDALEDLIKVRNTLSYKGYHPDDIKQLGRLPIDTKTKNFSELTISLKRRFRATDYYANHFDDIGQNDLQPIDDDEIKELMDAADNLSFPHLTAEIQKLFLAQTKVELYSDIATNFEKFVDEQIEKSTKPARINYEFMTSVSEIKSWIRKKVPVILSIRWSEVYYTAASTMRDGEKLSLTHRKITNLEAKGLSKDCIQKLLNGVVPVPNEEFINRSREREYITHAVICYGYDASENAFICRDNIGDRPVRNGFIKIEAGNFFNSRLEAANLSVVEAAVAVYIDED